MGACMMEKCLPQRASKACETASSANKPRKNERPPPLYARSLKQSACVEKGPALLSLEGKGYEAHPTPDIDIYPKCHYWFVSECRSIFDELPAAIILIQPHAICLSSTKKFITIDLFLVLAAFAARNGHEVLHGMEANCAYLSTDHLGYHGLSLPCV